MSATNEQPSREIVLAIELSNPSASPDAHAGALFSDLCDDDQIDSTLIGSMAIPHGIRSSDGIMALVEALCAKHEIKPGDLSRIIVSIGPGGYTALRIACTTAKVLAHSLGCTLIAVPTAKVAAAAIETGDRPALIALASKNDRAHCSIVHNDGTIESVGVIDASAIESLAVRTLVGDAHLPESFVDRAKQLGIEIKPIILDARWCLVAAQGIRPIEPIELGPMYAREPDAVTQWRTRTPK